MDARGAVYVFHLRANRFSLAHAAGQEVTAISFSPGRENDLIIGLADNVLRPILVGRDTKLPDYIVLFSTMGGIALLGINGFVIGPLIAAVFLAFWNIFISDNKPAVPGR